MKASAIVINAKDKMIQTTEIGHYKDIQAIVEGSFEDIGLLARTNTIDIHLYANERGRLMKFPYGFRINDFDVIGNGIVVGINRKSGNTVSLPSQFTMEWTDKLIKFLDLSGVTIMTPKPRVIFKNE